MSDCPSASSFVIPKSPSVVLFGHGVWGQTLARTLIGEGVLAAIVDPAPGTSLATPRVPHFHDLPAALRRRLRTAVIATPSTAHVPAAREALAAGLDLLIEKPLAPTLAEATALVRRARLRGRRIFPGHQLLAHPAYRALRSLVREGALGTLRQLRAKRHGAGRKHRGDDVLSSFAPHDLAYLLDLIPGPVSLQDATGQRASGSARWDACRATLRSPDGPVAELDVSWDSPRRERRLVVKGTRGQAVLDELDHVAPLRILTSEHPEGRVIPVDETPPLTLHLRAFLSGGENAALGAKHPTDAALEGLALIEAIRRRIETQSPASSLRFNAVMRSSNSVRVE